MLAILKRQFIEDPSAFSTTALEIEGELAEEFPPLSPIQIELQGIGKRRDLLKIQISSDEIQIATLELEIDKLKHLCAERRSILKGLDEHEKIISSGFPAQIAAGIDPEPKSGRKGKA